MKTAFKYILLIFFSCKCASLIAQNISFPGFIEDASFIYHSPSKAMFLLGGTPAVQDSVKSDVWKWNGNTWEVIEAKGPGARIFFKGGLNTETGEIELFAGLGLNRAQSSMRDLWVFDGKAWKPKKNNDIGSHDHFEMVYADHLNAFVLYGGNVNRSVDTTTWLMKDGVFTALKIAGPGVKYQSAMVYDKHRKKIVLYGGGDKADEHWEFDGGKWEKIITDVNPGIKMYHQMAYDENLKAVILHGGQINHRPLDPLNLKTPLTWLWDGSKWRKIGEEKIFALAMGYYPPGKSVIAYGFNDGDDNNNRSLQLWELKDFKWRKIEDYGNWNTLDYLGSFIKKHPDNSNAHYVYASTLRRLKRYNEAEAVYKKLQWQTMPEKIVILSGMLEVYMNLKKIPELEECILQLEKLGEMRRVSTTYYNLACSYALSGDKDKTFEFLNKAAEKGFSEKKHYENDEDLISLRSDERWKLLLEKLK